MPVRVLIVDDTPPFRQIARRLLEQRGYTVVGEAATAAEAIAAAERLAPDAVMIDIRLPDSSGFEVSAVLTRARPSPAVLLVSADQSPASDAVVASSGARGFILKSHLAVTDLSRFWPNP